MNPVPACGDSVMAFPLTQKSDWELSLVFVSVSSPLALVV